jgi:DNA-3-methyladenine glycosylase
MGITIAHNGLALDAAPLALYARTEDVEVVTGVRIGITKAVELPWRYGLKDSRYLSKPFAAPVAAPSLRAKRSNPGRR